MNPDYKSGRQRSPEVIGQIETIYDGMLGCGIRCEKYDGFEADDIVDWAVRDCVGKYDDIVIVGNDYDLCHSIQPGVRFKSIVPGVGCIHPGNFVESVEIGETIKFNTISAYKAFCGCSSDKIKGIKLSNGMKGKQIYYEFVKWLSQREDGNNYWITSFWKTPLVFANTSGLFTPEEFQVLYDNVKLVYPAEKPEGVEIKPVFFDDVNKEKFYKFLTLYGDQDSLNSLGAKRAFVSEEDKQMLREKSSKLSSGEFAADRNLQHQSRVATKTLDLDSFIREF
jgi:5'-3' exonuclease